ncbi:pyrroloquinoline quinone biosynthesis protein D [Breoghania corrubedonensis]|uniref:Pyrroloquinoline quinone biosynthesis protein D n=1 Tax=Breoghania corrubedonensis TaxID=665038 RepID=A0A2T5VHR0_9HYPH|nr:pyrroloquinoline quinone biosynthesis peptide chaperone PqqD [Breoghania corrubedonensis]PTW63290.1 pyrroloquinoline quinone biosynthesis protein D [Breoghania corrubedonensis]
MRPERITITPQCRPCLPRHVRLRFDDLRGTPIVLAPEKVLWPDEISAAILRLCDGTSSVAEIAAELARTYAAPVEEIETDILAFLQDWSDRLLINVNTDHRVSKARS